ncbi:MAG TPA: hypothetical protein VJS30_22655 [Paraburkholderia sp.]|nr:hypothetical protein [Paraburkholderia sp.]
MGVVVIRGLAPQGRMPRGGRPGARRGKDGSGGDGDIAGGAILAEARTGASGLSNVNRMGFSSRLMRRAAASGPNLGIFVFQVKNIFFKIDLRAAHSAASESLDLSSEGRSI